MTGRLLVLVTGASRGFGKHVAEEFVRQVAPSNALDLVLIARSGPNLESVAGAIDTMTKTIPDVSEAVVRREVVDLGDLERLEGCLDTMFSKLGMQDVGAICHPLQEAHGNQPLPNHPPLGIIHIVVIDSDTE